MIMLVWTAVCATACVATCSPCTKSYWFCTQCLQALSRSLPQFQIPSNFVGIVSSILTRSLYSSFSGIPHAWPSRRYFVRSGPFWWPFFRPTYLNYHRSYRLLTNCSGQSEKSSYVSNVETRASLHAYRCDTIACLVIMIINLSLLTSLLSLWFSFTFFYLILLF